MTRILGEFGSTYVARVFAAVFFFMAIGGLLLLLLVYSEQMTETLKGITMVLIGSLGPQAGVAFNRLADPSNDDLVSVKTQLAELRERLEREKSRAEARDEEQRRIIRELLDRLEPQLEQMKIEDKRNR